MIPKPRVWTWALSFAGSICVRVGAMGILREFSVVRIGYKDKVFELEE
jgi:hypothetical protein